jgi:hypothetical protein
MSGSLGNPEHQQGIDQIDRDEADVLDAAEDVTTAGVSLPARR